METNPLKNAWNTIEHSLYCPTRELCYMSDNSHQYLFISYLLSTITFQHFWPIQCMDRLYTWVQENTSGKVFAVGRKADDPEMMTNKRIWIGYQLYLLSWIDIFLWLEFSKIHFSLVTVIIALRFLRMGRLWIKDGVTDWSVFSSPFQIIYWSNNLLHGRIWIWGLREGIKFR